MSNCMKYGGKVKKMAPGGKVKQYSSGDDDSSPELDKKALEKSVEKRLKDVGNQKLNPPSNEGLKKLPTEVRNKMGYMKKGGSVKKGYHRMPDGSIMKNSAHKKKMAHGGMVGKCKRDGIAVRGKTRAGR